MDWGAKASDQKYSILGKECISKVMLTPKAAQKLYVHPPLNFTKQGLLNKVDLPPFVTWHLETY